mmetsp:Transcript_16149/g.19394  ORF Transcript_16149/g.19394 Transcript_16149/m.19394 type:complete len:352 (-) Transcript_16149:279-1334(-)|eukprot:CAMPEP_0197844328 /NCGR_PEP_ID=MMETSP1438-20131217/1307_1 /TAXON_ID=1461541 /ORGANISM="Pterosperma sp., Strain CCMP1384" /LENGTH=351 /DNA_ID=CAMNT_0043455049 /DNA_START=233 /DNA_END=1288 /DNA_ORIENTATION=+
MKIHVYLVFVLALTALLDQVSAKRKQETRQDRDAQEDDDAVQSFKDKYTEAADLAKRRNFLKAGSLYEELIEMHLEKDADYLQQHVTDEDEVVGNGLTMHLYNNLGEVYLGAADEEEDLEDLLEDSEVAYFNAAEIGEAIKARKALAKANGEEEPDGEEKRAKDHMESTELCRAYLALGRNYNMREGEEETALETYEKALKNCPHSSLQGFTFKEIGVLALKLQKYKQAEELLQKAADLDSKLPKVLSNLALAQQHLGKVDSAQETYEKALEQDPKNANLHANYGTLLARKEQYADAREAFENALKINPSHIDAADKLKMINDLGDVDEPDPTRHKPLSKRYIGPTPKVPN